MDDVWLAILMFLTKYIDKHAEKLSQPSSDMRAKQVKYGRIMHQCRLVPDKIKKLGRVFWSAYQSCWIEYQWESRKVFCPATFPPSASSTKPSPLPSSWILQTVVQLNQINDPSGSRIYFYGPWNDWVKILDKLLRLKQYDVDRALKKYVEHVAVTISKMISTDDGSLMEHHHHY